MPPVFIWLKFLRCRNMEQTQMRILLTGTTGQVGRALFTPLASLGTVLSINRNQLDLSRPETIGEAFDYLKPDLIINPAAYTAVDRAEDDRQLAFRVNADAPGAMAVWAARHNVPLVHFSTDYVFDGSGAAPWREDDVPAPLSAYGASKLAGENAVQAAGGEHLIVRTSWVYSNHGQNFMLSMVRLAEERKELRIVADQFGAPTSSRLIADAVMKILNFSRTGAVCRFSPRSDVINIASSGETSWHGFASAIIVGLKDRGIDVETERVVPIGTDDYPTKARRPQNSRLDSSRLNEMFGIKTLSWREALDIELDELADLRGISISPIQPALVNSNDERLTPVS
jgi:dTDP-4-dehydrorhamnose reductase